MRQRERNSKKRGRERQREREDETRIVLKQERETGEIVFWQTE